jgi:regulation of enolase protein 1 (concanavalin A-like superfamily)
MSMIERAVLPAPLRWLNEPRSTTSGAGALTIAAGARTDFFVHPASGAVLADAPAFVGPVEGDFVLSARVSVAFAATFDAGALFLWGGERCWAKLAFELSPQGERMVVSVVTQDRSDDSNSTVVEGDEVWLRAARIGDTVAFHSSLDGEWWNLVRHFHLAGAHEAGFEAQSPTGDGCTATFSEIRFEQRTLLELRDGS